MRHTNSFISKQPMFQLAFGLAGTNSAATLQPDTRFWLGSLTARHWASDLRLHVLYEFSYASEILEKPRASGNRGRTQERKGGASFSGLEAERNSSAN